MTREEIEKELNELPIGYISKKRINGKDYFYRQWVENGKIKSKYIKKGELALLEEQMDRKKVLQDKLKEMGVDATEKENTEVKSKPAKRRATSKKRSAKKEPAKKETQKKAPAKTNDASVLPEPPIKFFNHIVVGKFLQAMVLGMEDLESNLIVKKIVGYIDDFSKEGVCFVNGPLGENKSAYLKQAIATLKYDVVSRMAYVKVKDKNNTSEIINDLAKLKEEGYTYIFIDECDDVSWIDKTIADDNRRIVIAGHIEPEGVNEYIYAVGMDDSDFSIENVYEILKKNNEGKEIFYIDFEKNNDRGIVVYDQKKSECELYVVDNSTQINPQICMWLMDSENTSRIENTFGSIVSRNIVYEGKDLVINNRINYINYHMIDTK